MSIAIKPYISDEINALLDAKIKSMFPRRNIKSDIVNDALKEYLSNDFLAICKRFGVKPIKLDVTQTIINTIYFDHIIEGSQNIEVENSMFYFRMEVDIEVLEKSRIGEEVPEYKIDKIYYHNSSIYPADGFENIEFDFDVARIIDFIKG